MAIPAIIGAIAGAASAGASQIATGINLWQQQQNLDYQKDTTKQQWVRDDTAVQRRAADLEAAGLSKTLAAGSSAGNTPAIRTEAPQVDTQNLGFDKMAGAAQLYMGLMSQKSQIDKTQEENKLLRLQQQKQGLENAFLAAQNPLSLKLQEQTVNFNELANPKKLLQMDESNKGINLDNRLKSLDIQLKSLGIKQAQISLVKSKLDNDFQRLNIHGKSQDIIAKELAIKMAEVDLDNATYDTQWYHNQSIPRNFNFGLLQGPFGVASGLTNALNNILKGGKK